MTSKGIYSRDGDRGRSLQVSHTAVFAACPICGDRVIEYLMGEHVAGCASVAMKLATHIVRHGMDKKARSASWGRLWASLSMAPGYVCVGQHGRGQPLIVTPLA